MKKDDESVRAQVPRLAGTGSGEVSATDAAITKLADHFRYLDVLRDSGVTNMFGAGSYLQMDRGLSRSESHDVLSRWMKSDLSVSPEVRARAALSAVGGE